MTARALPATGNDGTVLREELYKIAVWKILFAYRAEQLSSAAAYEALVDVGARVEQGQLEQLMRLAWADPDAGVKVMIRGNRETAKRCPSE